jgi:hypothetical protein
MLRKKIEASFILNLIEELILKAYKGLQAIEDRVEKSLGKHKRSFQGWIMKTAVLGLSVFMSLACLVLGLFFIAIDYGGIPRGIVFICGGLLGLLVLRLMVPSTK